MNCASANVRVAQALRPQARAKLPPPGAMIRANVRGKWVRVVLLRRGSQWQPGLRLRKM